MAARKRKGATRGRRGSGNTASPMVWALGLLSVGLLVALLFMINLKTPEAPVAATPAVTIEPSRPPARVSTKPEPAIIPEPEQSPYSFYHELKNQAVIVPIDETASAHESAGPLLLPTKPVPANARQAFILQVGSFRKAQQADQMKARLALLGIKARIEKVRVSDGIWHRVRLGPFTSIKEANQLRSRLLSQKIKSMLVKVGQ